MSSRELFSQEALVHLEGLQHFAFQLCHNRQLSDDLVQETMLKAYRSFHSYRRGTNCRAWLYQICKNVYINLYRRRQLEPFAVDMGREAPEATGGLSAGDGHGIPVSLSDEADLRAHRQFLSDEVMGALSGLPAEYRTAVILSDIEGQTYEEIAQFMRVPIGTVRSRIHRGRKILAGRLGEYAGHTGRQRLARAA